MLVNFEEVRPHPHVPEHGRHQPVGGPARHVEGLVALAHALKQVH